MSSRSDLIKQFVKYTKTQITKHNYDIADDNIRIMSLNVHLLTDIYDKDNLTAIVDIINKYNPHILCLTECVLFKNKKPHFIKEMNNIGYDHIIMCNPIYGINVICSKIPIMSHNVIKLIADPIKKQNRYAIMCNISDINIICAHLDAYDETEETRLSQITSIYNQMPNDCILVGDLNSLNRFDYNDSEWATILKNDIVRNVISHTKVSDYISLKGFIDCVEKYDTCHMITVWSMRRIDYVYKSNAFVHKIKKCFVVPSLCSDHYPIFIDIKLRSVS